MILDKVLLSIIISITILPLAYGQNYCWEDEDDMCGLASENPGDMFGAIIKPLETQVGDLGFVIIWGFVLGIIWFKTENIMLLTIVGVLISATITGLSETAMGLGLLLAAISIGFLIFQMIYQRINLIN